MAVKPLTLKRQRAISSAKAKSYVRVVEVCVYGLPFHLPESFTYGIPEEFESLIETGSAVQVPFREKICEGVVLSIGEGNSTPLKPVISVESSRISPQLLDSARLIADRYICRLSEILKLIEPVSIVNESNPLPRRSKKQVSSKTLRGDWITNECRKILEYQALLIIIPTNRDLDQALEKFHSLGINCVDLRAPKNKRGSGKVFLGLRSSIFTQLPRLDGIWIIDESSDHHWERRHPKWNTRDVALLRYQKEDFELRFLSACSSLEIWRLEELGYIKSEKERFRRRRSKRIFFSDDSFQKAIKLGLEKGPVLVSVAGKDYVKALACMRCSAAPRCECGATLSVTAKGVLRCNLCDKSQTWRCSDCGNSKFVIIGKGALRIKEEFRKSFPNIPIYTSTADKEIENVPRKSIVIATSGMEPKGDFGGIISLDTLFLQNIPELRAEEKIRSRLFSLLNHLVDGGTFYLDLPANNRLSRAISLDSPESVIKEEIAERSQTKLPPNWRMIRIECEGVARAISGLLMEHPDVVVSYESSSVAILRSEVSKSGALTESIKLLQTYRSISKKSLLNIEMDPFKL